MLFGSAAAGEQQAASIASLTCSRTISCRHTYSDHKLQACAAQATFESWPTCLQVPDAQHMNVGSGTQLRQLLYAGVANSKSKQPAHKAAVKTAKGEAAAADDRLELERVFKVSCTAVVGQAAISLLTR